MRTDFTPDNVELWISNWKRKDQIDFFVRQWLDSFDFEYVNVIVNHSSVTEEDFGLDIRPFVRVWNNVMRHDDAIGPMTENYNQAYVHTFLSGKKYCICAHDNMEIEQGWDDIIRHTDYDLYTAPQGDQIHVITLDGLRHYGWWDERYATNGNHELDYIVRALRRDLLTGDHRSSLVDWHGWPDWPTGTIELMTEDGYQLSIDSPIIKGNPYIPSLPTLSHNSVGLESYWKRANKNDVPQTGPKTPQFRELKWNNKKWGGDPQRFESFVSGPTYEEIDWYPWLDLETLTTDRCAIT